jgi:hypothetical protein
MSDTDTDTAVQDAQDEFYLYNVVGIFGATRNSKKDTAEQATTLAKIEAKVDQISVDVRDIKMQNLDARLRVVEEKLGKARRLNS